MRRARLDVPAIADDGHDVGELADLFEPVADVKDGDAAVTQATHRGEKIVDLVGRERGGRLVHDQQPRARGERLRDLEQLPIGDTEPRTGVSGSISTAQLPEDAACLDAHRAPVDGTQTTPDVTAGKDVLRDRQVLEDGRLLVHRHDAEPVGGLRVGDPPRRAVHHELALVGLNDPGEDFHERRLAGAVLPDKGVHGAGTNGEAHLGDGPNAAVASRDAAQLHQRSSCRKRRSYAIAHVDSHELKGFNHIV